MTPPPPRRLAQRIADARHRLENDVDAWVASADPESGVPYLVPLSFLWDGATLLFATPASSPTGRNLSASGGRGWASDRPATSSWSRGRRRR